MKTKFFFILLSFSIILAFSIVGNAQRTNKTASRKPTRTNKPITLSAEQAVYVKNIIKRAKDIEDGYQVYINSPDVDNLFGGALESFSRIRPVELPKAFQDEVDFLIHIVNGWRELRQLLDFKRDSLNAIQYQTQLDAILDEYKMSGMSNVKAFNAFRQIANNSRIKLENMFAPYANSASVENEALREKVVLQISNLSKYIQAYEKVATSFENNDRDAKSGKLPQTAIRINEQNKQVVIKTLTDMQSGILDLEKELSDNPKMTNNQSLIKELSDLSNLAKTQAEAGKFTESKTTLSTLLDKLTAISNMISQ